MKELLEHAMKHVHIKYVLIDRGFFSVEVIKLLKTMNCKFIMPASKNKKIKRVIKGNLNKKDIEDTAELYRKRWGIETGYRVKKDFLAITTT